jgi:hypothetical protein
MSFEAAGSVEFISVEQENDSHEASEAKARVEGRMAWIDTSVQPNAAKQFNPHSGWAHAICGAGQAK